MRCTGKQEREDKSGGDPSAHAPECNPVGPTRRSGAATVIDSALGHRVGFWNPAIYNFAAKKSSRFTPLDKSVASHSH